MDVPPGLGNAIGPLGLVSGTPFYFDVTMQRNEAGTAIVMLRLEHAVGSTCVVMPPDFADRVAQQLKVIASDCRRALVVPSRSPARTPDLHVHNGDASVRDVADIPGPENV